MVIEMAGVAAFVTAAAGALKVIMDGRKTRAEVAILNEQLTTENSGSTVRDALVRIEAGQSEIRSDIRGIRRDVGRLFDADHEDRENSITEHKRLWERLDQLLREHDEGTGD